MARLKTKLTLASDVYGGKVQAFRSQHLCSTVFDTTFKVNNSDTFSELIEFAPDGTKTFDKFNYLALSNTSNQPAEIQIILREFNVGSDVADANPETATMDFILHPGKYFILPSSKVMVYSADPDENDVWATGDTSAGNKDGTSLYDVAYNVTGPKFIDPPSYFCGSQTHGNPLRLTATGNYFEADIEDDFFKTMMMGDSTTGISNSKIALFGECHADEVGTLQTISAIGADGSATYTNTRLTLSAVGNDISSGTGTYIGAYKSVMRLNGAHTASVTTVTYEDNGGSNGDSNASMFKKYDIIRVGNELMQVVGDIAQTTMTVKRGCLGTTAAAHADQDAIGFHYMNGTLSDVGGVKGIVDMKGNSNIYTDNSGQFRANTFLVLEEVMLSLMV